MNDKVNGAIALIIDYSNGVRKSFNNIPWRSDMAVYDVLEVAADTKPGVNFQFEKTGVDRGGRDIGEIAAIDDMAADQENQNWLIWVNQSFFKTELRWVTPESVTQFGIPSVQPGDTIVLKLAEAS